jgi:hypothetical protein
MDQVKMTDQLLLRIIETADCVKEESERAESAEQMARVERLFSLGATLAGEYRRALIAS